MKVAKVAFCITTFDANQYTREVWYPNHTTVEEKYFLNEERMCFSKKITRSWWGHVILINNLYNIVYLFFFTSPGIIDCICFYFSSAHALGASVVLHNSLPLMNSLNKSEASIFFMQTVLPEGFLFQWNYTRGMVSRPSCVGNVSKHINPKRHL